MALMLAFTLAATSAAASPYDEPCREAELYLALLAQRLSLAGSNVQTVVREGWAADIIAYGCEEMRPGLIVMATHGRTGVARLLLRNVALEVVRRSPLPVMLIWPAGTGAQGRLTGTPSRIRRQHMLYKNYA